MLRQDSIQSAELKKKESPFRAKCHEIFCCPLKQVHLKENTEPEGLWRLGPCSVCLVPFCVCVPGVPCVPSLRGAGAMSPCLPISVWCSPGHCSLSHPRGVLGHQWRCFSSEKLFVSALTIPHHLSLAAKAACCSEGTTGRRFLQEFRAALCPRSGWQARTRLVPAPHPHQASASR